MPILGAVASSRLTGPTTSYESIATTTVGSGGASNVEFTSIPSTYTHLQVRYISENNSSAQYNLMRFNSDSTSVYASHFLYGDGASAAATASSGDTSIYGGRSYSSSNVYWSHGVIDILDYTNTNKFKTTRTLTADEANGSGVVMLLSGLWRSTSAITSIKFEPSVAGNFRQYTQFALYGIKGS